MLIDTALRYACAVLLAALVGSNAYWLAHSRGLAGERDKAIAAGSALAADIANQRAEFEARARQQEREQRAAIDGVRAIFDREMTDAKKKHDAVAAGLRAGTLKLRQHWAACAATAELSAAAAAAARADDAARLRAEGAGDLVRVGAECNAVITALQRDARICRGGTP